MENKVTYNCLSNQMNDKQNPNNQVLNNTVCSTSRTDC